jgi:hypothetical protein
MSKKTVVFKMPAREAPIGEDQRAPVSSSREEQTSPIARLATRANEQPGSSKPDQWVRRREPQPAAHAPVATDNSVTIDLAAERHLLEVATLMFLLPPLLGWFWLSRAVNRAWGRFG